jgi:phosphinothricin acetyltransferase
MVKIRRAELSDLEQITEIYNWAIRNTTATFDIIEQTVEQRRAWFEHYKGVYPLIVAEHDGRVAGYSSLSRFREKEAFARTVELSVYVHPDRHGNGIGTLLMQTIIDMAWKLGHHVIVSGITSGNEVSIKMHEKLGFNFCGRFSEVGFKFDRWQDVDFYQLVSKER